MVVSLYLSDSQLEKMIQRCSELNYNPCPIAFHPGALQEHVLTIRSGTERKRPDRAAEDSKTYS